MPISPTRSLSSSPGRHWRGPRFTTDSFRCGIPICVGDAAGVQLGFSAVQRPRLIGYLFPLHLAYTVQVVITLAIAGTGV